MGSSIASCSSRNRVRDTLERLHLLQHARSMKQAVDRAQTLRYWKKVVATYADERSRPYETFDQLEDLERAALMNEAETRWKQDRALFARLLLQGLGNEDPSQDIGALAENRLGEDPGDPRTPLAGSLLALLNVPAGGTAALPAALAELDIETDEEPGPARDGKEIARIVVGRLVEEGRVPRYYDYDYLDDLVPIVRSRYATGNGIERERSEPILQALSVLAGGSIEGDAGYAGRHVARLLGPDHGFVPRRGEVNDYVQSVIPDLVDEFVALRAEDDVDRFLEINREYSRRQQAGQGRWDNRDLALLRDHETDHHLLLRTLVGLRRDGQLRSHDPVLVIGPRHVDELVFFRKHLGLKNTVGLDLFADPDSAIVAADMHDMPFESGRFKLVFCAGTLSYAYNSRKVIGEIARVLDRPGYAFLMDAGDRRAGPDPLGRSDTVDITTAIGFFHEHPSRVLAKDPGKSLAPLVYTNNPCLAIELR